MSGYHIIVEAKDDRDDGIAKEVARILCEAYPGHPWHISVAGGMIVIKLMNISNKMGIARRYDRLTFDATIMKKEIVRAGGEFLERARLARGAYRGQQIGEVDGIEAKDRVIA